MPPRTKIITKIKLGRGEDVAVKRESCNKLLREILADKDSKIMRDPAATIGLEQLTDHLQNYAVSAMKWQSGTTQSLLKHNAFLDVLPAHGGILLFSSGDPLIRGLGVRAPPPPPLPPSTPASTTMAVSESSLHPRLVQVTLPLPMSNGPSAAASAPMQIDSGAGAPVDEGKGTTTSVSVVPAAATATAATAVGAVPAVAFVAGTTVTTVVAGSGAGTAPAVVTAIVAATPEAGAETKEGKQDFGGVGMNVVRMLEIEIERHKAKIRAFTILVDDEYKSFQKAKVGYEKKREEMKELEKESGRLGQALAALRGTLTPPGPVKKVDTLKDSTNPALSKNPPNPTLSKNPQKTSIQAKKKSQVSSDSGSESDSSSASASSSDTETDDDESKSHKRTEKRRTNSPMQKKPEMEKTKEKEQDAANEQRKRRSAATRRARNVGKAKMIVFTADGKVDVKQTLIRWSILNAEGEMTRPGFICGYCGSRLSGSSWRKYKECRLCTEHYTQCLRFNNPNSRGVKLDPKDFWINPNKPSNPSANLESFYIQKMHDRFLVSTAPKLDANKRKERVDDSDDSDEETASKKQKLDLPKEGKELPSAKEGKHSESTVVKSVRTSHTDDKDEDTVPELSKSLTKKAGDKTVIKD